MGSQWSRDSTYTRAVKEGYRSRAAFKLIEIQARFGVIHDGDTVVDLGASPGSWLQVVNELTSGKILGVDLNPIAPLDGVTTLIADLTDPELPAKLLDIVGEVNVVVSDASPKISGQKSYDQARAIALGEEALCIAQKTLKTGGDFVVKSFQGGDFPELIAMVRPQFRLVKAYRTSTSRKGSSEVYIIAKYFIGRDR
jgi:23S rRNA (uridine2552-2'-O)-methyltransferase